MLREIVVKAKKIDRNYYFEPDNVYVPGDDGSGYTDIFQMISGRFPGVMVTGREIHIRGISSIVMNTQPLFLIDGVPVSSDSGASNALSMIPPSEVEKIEVLKSASNLAIFGSRGANGVIAIYLKNGIENIGTGDSPNFSPVTFRGFSMVKEYYTPENDNHKPGTDIPDIRSLLYWNPALRTNRKGEVEFDYYNSDSAKKHQVIIEGISDYGDVIYLNKMIGQDTP